MDGNRTRAAADHDVEELLLVARGIATAAAPEGGLTDAQEDLLEAIARTGYGVSIDYRALEPIGPEEFAELLGPRTLVDRRRIVHHLVLAELLLRPIPVDVAHRVATYAAALGIEDDFVRIARRYAQGAFGLAWMDLRRNGFVDHVREARSGDDAAHGRPTADPFVAAIDLEVAARWAAFADLPAGSLGRSVWEMYDGRGFSLPGTPHGAPVYLAQHDFVHVLADYGTNLTGELEVFGLISRADPDPKGFAWLATMIGLFETGYISSTGFFDGDRRGHNLSAPGMHVRLADAIRRGKAISNAYGVDLFEVDYSLLASRPVEDVRDLLGVPPKSPEAIDGGSAGLFDVAGMSERQRMYAAQRPGGVT